MHDCSLAVDRDEIGRREVNKISGVGDCADTCLRLGLGRGHREWGGVVQDSLWLGLVAELRDLLWFGDNYGVNGYSGFWWMAVQN